MFITIFLVPLFVYKIGLVFGADRLTQIVISIVALFVVDLLWRKFSDFLLRTLDRIFLFLIDVVPADGRNNEEALLVVTTGEWIIKQWELQRDANEWSDETIEFMVKYTPIGRIFFSNKIRKRLYALRKYYIDHPEVTVSEENNKKFLTKNNLSISFVEHILTHGGYRNTVIAYSSLLLLFIFNPLVG
jgi:hypothetical protein